MGLTYEGTHGHFAPVKEESARFSTHPRPFRARQAQRHPLDFDNREGFEHHHYAFHVTDEDFDAIFERVKAEGLAYGSDPRAQDNMEINTRRGGRGFYFKDPNGHSLELLTVR